MKYTKTQVAEFKAMVALTGDDAVTTSRKVAEFFSKDHHNILKKVDSLVKDMPDDFAKVNFNVCHEINKLQNNKKVRFYELTKNGFMFVAMSLTGKKAAEWKVKFIQAFDWLADQNNTMQKELDAFTKMDALSKSNGSFHGKGLNNRKLEKSKLEEMEVKLKDKWQPMLLGVSSNA